MSIHCKVLFVPMKLPANGITMIVLCAVIISPPLVLCLRLPSFVAHHLCHATSLWAISAERVRTIGKVCGGQLCDLLLDNDYAKVKIINRALDLRYIWHFSYIYIATYLHIIKCASINYHKSLSLYISLSPLPVSLNIHIDWGFIKYVPYSLSMFLKVCSLKYGP